MLRWVVRGLLLVGLAVGLYGVLPRLGGLARDTAELRHARRLLVAAAIVAQAVSLASYALLYRRVLGRTDRFALAFMSSTQLPLVLAITTVATASGHMRASTAAALVGAAVLSTLVFPVLGLRLRGDLASEPIAVAGETS